MSVLKWYLHLHDIRAWWIFTKSQHPMFSGPLNTLLLYPFIVSAAPYLCQTVRFAKILWQTFKFDMWSLKTLPALIYLEMKSFKSYCSTGKFEFL